MSGRRRARPTAVIDTRTALGIAVGLGRGLARSAETPQPGDLVIEVTGMSDPDPDAIGWLVGEGIAPYVTECPACGNPFDGTDGALHEERDRARCGKCGAGVDARHVWDVRPLSGARGREGNDVQRWENATFVKTPPRVSDFVGRSLDAADDSGPAA